MTSAATETRTATRERPQTEPPKMWNVVLLDDDDHTYTYVILMVQSIFGFDPERAFQIAEKVDTEGRAVCLTTHKEHAELKRDQIHAFGPDLLSASSAGAMSAIIEPAEFEGDDADGP